MAWVTGVMLLILVFVAMPVKYIGDQSLRKALRERMGLDGSATGV